MIQIDMEKPSACWWEDEENNTHLCPFMDKEFDCLIQGRIGYWSWDGQYENCPLHEADSDTINRRQAIDAAIEAVDEWGGGFNFTRACIIKKALNALPPSPTLNRPKGAEHE